MKFERFSFYEDAAGGLFECTAVDSVRVHLQDENGMVWEYKLSHAQTIFEFSNKTWESE